jgi:hypothetical protein
VLKNYYPATFSSLWTEIDQMVATGELISVEEVREESLRRTDSPHLLDWIQRNTAIFAPPTEDEMAFVAEIFSVEHFRQLVGADVLLRGGFVADPWLIARAKVLGGCVVTEERIKQNAAKIPNVCEHFGVEYTNVETLLASKGWRY